MVNKSQHVPVKMAGFVMWKDESKINPCQNFVQLCNMKLTKKNPRTCLSVLRSVQNDPITFSLIFTGNYHTPVIIVINSKESSTVSCFHLITEATVIHDVSLVEMYQSGKRYKRISKDP